MKIVETDRWKERVWLVSFQKPVSKDDILILR